MLADSVLDCITAVECSRSGWHLLIAGFFWLYVIKDDSRIWVQECYQQECISILIPTQHPFPWSITVLPFCSLNAQCFAIFQSAAAVLTLTYICAQARTVILHVQIQGHATPRPRQATDQVPVKGILDYNSKLNAKCTCIKDNHYSDRLLKQHRIE